MAELDDSTRSKIEGPNLAFLAEVMEDGSPHVSPVWIDHENGHLTFNTAIGRLKERNIRRDARVALSIADRDDPFSKVDIRGRVVEIIEGEEAERQIDALAKKYIGQDTYPWRRPGRGPGQGAGRAARRRLSRLLFLSRAEVAGLLPDVPAQLDLVEHAYRALAAGRVELPPKPGVHPRKDSFLHAMPAYLRDEDVVTLKWVGGYPANKKKGLPYISGLIVVNDAETGLPVAVMDGAEITAARTAAASGVCVRRFAPAGWRRAAILGCGEQGLFHARLLRALEPGVEIRAWDPHPERIARLGDLAEPAASWEDALAGAEVVVTAGPIVEDPPSPLRSGAARASAGSRSPSTSTSTSGRRPSPPPTSSSPTTWASSSTTASRGTSRAGRPRPGTSARASGARARRPASSAATSGSARSTRRSPTPCSSGRGSTGAGTELEL